MAKAKQIEDAEVAEKAAPKALLPKRIKLNAPFAYFTDSNVLKQWPQGFTATDEAEIADLIGRGAHYHAVEA